MERNQSLGTKYILPPSHSHTVGKPFPSGVKGRGEKRKVPGCKGGGGGKQIGSKREDGREKRKWGSGSLQLVGITALQQKGHLSGVYTAFHLAGAGRPGKARPPGRSAGRWAPPPGGCLAAPRGPAGAQAQRRLHPRR